MKHGFRNWQFGFIDVDQLFNQIYYFLWMFMSHLLCALCELLLRVFCHLILFSQIDNFIVTC